MFSPDFGKSSDRVMHKFTGESSGNLMESLFPATPWRCEGRQGGGPAFANKRYSLVPTTISLTYHNGPAGERGFAPHNLKKRGSAARNVAHNNEGSASFQTNAAEPSSIIAI